MSDDPPPTPAAPAAPADADAWPPPIAPRGAKCVACRYDLVGLGVQLPDGIVLCPECGLPTRLARRTDGPHVLQQFDVPCFRKDGTTYAAPFVAASPAEACFLARSDGHKVDPAWAERHVDHAINEIGRAISAIAGLCALGAFCAWPIAGVSAALSLWALSVSGGRNGRIPLILTLACAVGGLLLRAFYK